MVRPGRRPGRSETRGAIIAAAREMFAERGYERASIRAIAASAGVDPALVHHFFGAKEQVFVAAMNFPIDPAEVLPRVLDGPREETGERLVELFLSVWSNPDSRESFVALLRAGMTNDQAAAMFREFVSGALLDRGSKLLDVPRLRIEAAMAQLVGMAILRYVIRIEPLASISDEEVMALMAPTVQRYFQ